MRTFIKDNLFRTLLLIVILIAADMLSSGIERGLKGVEAPSYSHSNGWVHVRSFNDGYDILNSDNGTMCFVPRNQEYSKPICHQLP